MAGSKDLKKPLFNWLNERSAGVLLPISCLPSKTGIGNLGSGAMRFLEFLEACSIKVWQVCPLGPTGFGDSPYQCFSAFAGNPYFIDLEPLAEAGLITKGSLSKLSDLPFDHVDYGRLYQLYPSLLLTAYKHFVASGADSFPGYGCLSAFRKEQGAWLEDYALFMALKEKFGGSCWLEWPDNYRDYSKALKQKSDPKTATAIDACVFQQYLFYGQLKKLRSEAARRNIQLMGDIPIFVAPDSADVWSKPELFELDTTGHPIYLAGVPPDSFSEDGQLWGNPVYRWKNHLKTGFKWWLDRLQSNLEIFDILRLDHFRGFESYWAIPAGETTARNGEWLPCPGLELFKALKKACPEAKLVAEDLGVITEEVDTLCRQTGLPRMAVLQFAFGDGAENPFLPHNLKENCLLYPGTHDNETSTGWYQSAATNVQDHVRRYLSVDGDALSWDFIRAAFRSNASMAIIPLQDFMSLGNEARFNSPGQSTGNWQWRFTMAQLNQLKHESADYIKELVQLYGRN